MKINLPRKVFNPLKSQSQYSSNANRGISKQHTQECENQLNAAVVAVVKRTVKDIQQLRQTIPSHKGYTNHPQKVRKWKSSLV